MPAGREDVAAIDRAFLLTRVVPHQAVSGLCPKRREQRQSGQQLALFS